MLDLGQASLGCPGFGSAGPGPPGWSPPAHRAGGGFAVSFVWSLIKLSVLPAQGALGLRGGGGGGARQKPRWPVRSRRSWPPRPGSTSSLPVVAAEIWPLGHVWTDMVDGGLHSGRPAGRPNLDHGGWGLRGRGGVRWRRRGTRRAGGARAVAIPVLGSPAFAARPTCSFFSRSHCAFSSCSRLDTAALSCGSAAISGAGGSPMGDVLRTPRAIRILGIKGALNGLCGLLILLYWSFSLGRVRLLVSGRSSSVSASATASVSGDSKLLNHTTGAVFGAGLGAKFQWGLRAAPWVFPVLAPSPPAPRLLVLLLRTLQPLRIFSSSPASWPLRPNFPDLCQAACSAMHGSPLLASRTTPEQSGDQP